MQLTYGIKDRPKFGKNLVFAFQQMIAIMAATLLVPILVTAAGLKCDPAAALFGAGAGTIVPPPFPGRHPSRRARRPWD